MGVLFFFDETVPAENINHCSQTTCQVEVADNHGIPELRVEPEGEAQEGIIATFKDWELFEKFVDAVNNLHSRLRGI